jgi:transposase InsO family protein
LSRRLPPTPNDPCHSQSSLTRPLQHPSGPESSDDHVLGNALGGYHSTLRAARWVRSRCRNPVWPYTQRDEALRDARCRCAHLANPLWGAPRIHGELLKLGINVGQTSVAKYMARHRRPPSQGWRTFLRNHADGIAAMDLFVVPTLSFRLLYGLLILNHVRRQILSPGVTAHPTAEWVARQLTEACGWDGTPEYLVRDHDSVYGAIFTRRLRAMGTRDRPIAPRSPWQNGYVERPIGSLRRECFDHVIFFGERHLRHILLLYIDYYNRARTHLSLNKDAPVPREIQAIGAIHANPILGGLH